MRTMGLPPPACRVGSLATLRTTRPPPPCLARAGGLTSRAPWAGCHGLWGDAPGRRAQALPSLASLPPPPDPPLPPRVEHLIVPAPGPASCVLEAHLGLSPAAVEALVAFGAVYHSPVPPPPPPNPPPPPAGVDPAQAQLQDEAAERRAGLKGHEGGLMKPRRLEDPLLELQRGGFLRVHVHPKRFPAAHAAEWQSLLLEVADAYVVLNKPAGVSVGPTVDNVRESCVALAGEAVGSEAPLAVLHRLDVCTQGVLVMGRTKPFTSYFNKLLRKRKVAKTYRTLSLSPPPHGLHTHWAEVDAGARAGVQGRTTRRTRMHAREGPGRHECILEVVATAEREVVRAHAAAVLGLPSTAGPLLPGEGPVLRLWESEVRLVTGRTHQIRSQFEALGAPLLGDTLYTPGLDPRDVREPEGAIGLQAWKLELRGGGGDHFGLAGKVFEAPDPWWRG